MQPASKQATHCSLSALFFTQKRPMLITHACASVPDKDKTSHYNGLLAQKQLYEPFSKKKMLFAFPRSKPVQAILHFTIEPPTVHTSLYLAKRINTKRRRLHQQVRRYALGLAPLKEVVALGDQYGPFGKCSSSILARSGHHAHRLEGAVIAGVLGLSGLQGELGWKGELGRIQPAISACDEIVDVLIYPLEGDLERQCTVGGCRSCSYIHRTLRRPCGSVKSR